MAPSQSFDDHVKELRRRCLYVVLAVGISAGLAYGFRNDLIIILQKPLQAPLYYTSPAGSFNFVLKLSLVVGMFIALPVALYQLLRFIEPALNVPIRRGLFLKVIGSSFVLATAGICFGFFLMVPLSLHFFLGYSTEQIKPIITADTYLSFVLNHMLTFAFAFQIPMIFWFINRIKPLNPSNLLKYQRHVIVAAFAVALILPFTYDPLSQFIVAIPIIFLYYLSVVMLWFVNRKSRKLALKTVAKPLIRISAAPQLVPEPAMTPATSLIPNNLVTNQQHLITNTIDGFIRPRQSN